MHKILCETTILEVDKKRLTIAYQLLQKFHSTLFLMIVNLSNYYGRNSSYSIRTLSKSKSAGKSFIFFYF